MKHFTRESLKDLMQSREGPAVSMYVPTTGVGGEVRQNAVRFKHVLRSAEEGLHARGHRPARVAEILAPAVELLESMRSWRTQPKGVALFLAPGFARSFRVPAAVPEMAVVSDRDFHVKPLIPLVAEEGRFYLLTLSQNQVRFYQAFLDGMDEVPLEELPESLSEALARQGVESLRQFQVHSGSGAGVERSGVSHAHDPRQLDKERLVEYFRQVEAALWKVLHEEKAPLLLAGVEYLHPLYRACNRYPHLMDEGLHGNVDKMGEADLFGKAWALMEGHLRKRRDDAKARFQELAGTSQVSTELEKVVPAACQGRVDTLFVPVGVQRWGHFLADESRVEFGETEANGNVDLLNLAAVETLTAGGRVLALDPGQVPGDGAVAAVFRY